MDKTTNQLAAIMDLIKNSPDAEEFASYGWHEKKYRDRNAPRVVPVIMSTASRGSGVEGDPCRGVLMIHDLTGLLLAENDTWSAKSKENIKELRKIAEMAVEAQKAAEMDVQLRIEANLELQAQLADLKRKYNRLRRK